MMSKKNYETPLLEVLDFDFDDIVTSSINRSIDPNAEQYEGDVIKFGYQSPNT